MTVKEAILGILELGLKEDGTFYSNEEKANMLETYFNHGSEFYKKRME